MSDNRPMITVKEGKLQGKLETTLSGFKFNSYKGIPYAKPPLGNLRFKAPEPAEPWQGIYDATMEKNPCPQLDLIFLKEYIGNEDCLYLNVHVPIGFNEPLPVMFWVHGGGFHTGSGSEVFYGPDHLVEKGVILVTINYRLGPLGFLCLHTPKIPGNAGLKDQALALKWVKENISSFGGDPNNITLFGESAGAVSVDMLVASKTTKELFKKAITQSGSCCAWWAINENPIDSAISLAKVMGLDTQNVEELEEFFMKASAEDMAKMIKSRIFSPGFLNIVPVVEKEHANQTSFFTEHPRNIIAAGKHNICPMINGMNSNEGLMFVLERLKDGKPKTWEELIPDIKGFIPPRADSKITQTEIDQIVESIKQGYFSSGDPAANYTKMASDVLFVHGNKVKNEFYKKYSNQIYSYVFGYHGKMNLVKAFFDVPYMGASHADDIGYLFRIKDLEEKKPIQPDQRDLYMREKMTKMWTNFAKFGNPTPEKTSEIPTWNPMSKTSMECMSIDEQMKTLDNPYDKQLGLWDKLVHM